MGSEQPADLGDLLAPIAELDRRLRELGLSLAAKTREALASRAPQATSELQVMRGEFVRLHAEMKAELTRVQEVVGIPDNMLEALERAELPRSDDRYWRRQIEATPSTGSLDCGLRGALASLRSLAPPEWLESERTKPFRLGASSSLPLHIVAGTRLPPLADLGPQRFARMLLTAQDYLDRRDDLDFFSASILVPEVSLLGQHLEHVRNLGPEALRKLHALWEMPDEMVASTVHELLVGAALGRRGWSVTMLAESRRTKTPDLRILDFPVPAVVECKRRVGLSDFELREARVVEELYVRVGERLRAAGAHVSIEVDFSSPIGTVAPEDFESAVNDQLGDSSESCRRMAWGAVRVVRLPYTVDVPRCRLFSPMYLERVFAWHNPPLAPDAEWDGILCQVEHPERSVVTSARNPNCMKWRSTSDDALLKKARGIASLWAKAAQQVPDGEMGFIYIAYPEGARPRVADDRTRDLLTRVQTRFFHHRAAVQIPLAVVARLFARPIGYGIPDLVESCIPLFTAGDDHLLGSLPTCVFTNRPEVAAAS